MPKKILKLIIALAIPQAAGLIGSVFTRSSLDSWYRNLEKPFISPPDFIFGPVWIIIFFLMGLALFLVWIKKDTEDKKMAYWAFAIQLLLNVLWSVLFFGLKSPGLALLEIFILWFAILANIITFHKISRTSAYLLAPYILWILFAMYLNLCIWQINM